MIPWRREWLPTPVFLPGEFHGQWSLAGYSPWDLKESDMTEQLTHMCARVHTHTHTLSQESYLRGSSMRVGDPMRFILFKGTNDQAHNPGIFQQGLRGIKSTYLKSMK